MNRYRLLSHPFILEFRDYIQRHPSFAAESK